MAKRTHRIGMMLTGMIALLVIHLSFALSDCTAADNPHNTANAVNCSNCHDKAKSAANPDWWENQQLYVCGQCHNSASAGTDVVTHHDNANTVLAQCTSCHDPHNQMQLRTWKTEGYLFTGASTSVTTTTLFKSGAGWITNQWAGMLLVPNVLYPGYNYRIVSNTGDTLTLAANTSMNLVYAKAGDTFAIAYGKLIRDTVNGMPVKYFRQTGANSFADVDGTVDGICQVCHTQTKFFTVFGTLDSAGGFQHPVPGGTKCTSCHKHQDSFKATCDACHGYPPVDSATLVKSDGSTTVFTGSAVPGAHGKHATNAGLNYDCTICHVNSSGSGATHNNGAIVTIGFSETARTNVSGNSTYNGQTAVLYDSSSASTSVARSGAKTCSNIYCHSTVQANGGVNAPVYKTVAWDAFGSVTCGTCHDVLSPRINTGSHEKHLDKGSVCGDCHTGAGNGTGYNSLSHANANIDVAAGYPAVNPPGNGYGICSTSACHSNGKGTFSTATWGGTSPGCTFCHPTLSGKHSSHVVFTNFSLYGGTGNASTNAAYDFECGNCHPTSAASHMNGVINLSLNAADGGVLKSKNVSPVITGAGDTIQCNGVYCHSNGRSIPEFAQTPPWGSGFADSSNTCGQCHGNSPSSGAHALHAVGIHFEDVYSGNIGKRPPTGGAGSGAAHGDPAVSATISCNICHAATLSKARNKYGSACSGCHAGDSASTAIVSADLAKTMHVNGVRNVSFAAVQIKSNAQIRDNIPDVIQLNTYWQRVNNYKAGASSHDQARVTLSATAGYAGGTCSTVACHNGFPVTWSTTNLSCDGCHTNLPQ